MDKYLGVFENEAAISAATANGTLHSPYVAMETSGNTLSYNGDKKQMVRLTVDVDEFIDPNNPYPDEHIDF